MAFTWTLSVLNEDNSIGMVLNLESPGGLLGRAEDNTYVVDIETISNIHCRLSVDPEGDWWLKDLNSTNGTWKDDQEIQGLHRLTEDEILEFGIVKVRVDKKAIAEPDPQFHDNVEVQEPGVDESHRIQLDADLDAQVMDRVPMDKPIYIELEDAEKDIWD